MVCNVSESFTVKVPVVRLRSGEKCANDDYGVGFQHYRATRLSHNGEKNTRCIYISSYAKKATPFSPLAGKYRGASKIAVL